MLGIATSNASKASTHACTIKQFSLRTACRRKLPARCSHVIPASTATLLILRSRPLRRNRRRMLASIFNPTATSETPLSTSDKHLQLDYPAWRPYAGFYGSQPQKSRYICTSPASSITHSPSNNHHRSGNATPSSVRMCASSTATSNSSSRRSKRPRPSFSSPLNARNAIPPWPNKPIKTSASSPVN